MPDQAPFEGEWKNLKSDAEHALQTLLSQINRHTNPQELFEAYTYAKRVTADALKSRMLMHLPAENSKFRELYAKVQKELNVQYGEFFPDGFLKAPYGNQLHERLFSLLEENFSQPIEAAKLRIVTADGVHTERRTRELRELGMDVDWYEEDGLDFYVLRSFDLNFEVLPSLVRTIVRNKRKSKAERERLLRNAGIPVK
ncbi:hypothetical protein [Streptomyces canus]|uniref:hypothetical protein n=1 Tax=Streptomyces canus TaxID=58343 RepID=UPI0027809FBA|nr:hypothetical protein [Streptomyces canus]MDQ0761099.1 hypothetical protein [Streptomyces canus]